MPAALLISRLLLAAVFLTAGLAKLADRQGSREALAEFGVPPTAARAAAAVLPLAEIAVAVTLLTARWAYAGAIGALALLVLFMAGIARSIARGEAPDCHCFGQIHSEPAGPKTLLRNAVLAALAVGVLANGVDQGSSAVAWIGQLHGDQPWIALQGAALIMLAAASARAALALLRQNGRLLMRIDELEARLGGDSVATTGSAGLPVGLPAPDFSLTDVHGERGTLAALRADGRPLLLVFSDPGCGPCNALMPDLGRWQREHAGVLSIAVLSRGDVGDNRAKSVEHGVNNLYLQRDREVAESYRVNGTPGAVLVDPEGRIASAAALGADQIQNLLAQAVRGSVRVLNVLPPAAASPATLEIGAPAPNIALTDDTGEPILLTEPGRDTLLLFWNPTCGFCASMLADLRRWEVGTPPATAARTIVISQGSPAAHAAMAIRAPIAADPQAAVADAFGAAGTPSGLRIGSDGRVASTIAVGAAEFFALAGWTP